MNSSEKFIATPLRRSYGRTWYNVLFYFVLDTVIGRKKIFRQPKPEFGVATSNNNSRRNIQNTYCIDKLFVRLRLP